jgi:hypothetical protein
MRIIRGDTSKFKFQRLDTDGNPILIPAVQIYFTVKKNAGDKNFVFQKTLQEMELDAEGFYHVIIEPSDTNTMRFGNYVYDIEVITDDYKQTIVLDDFIVGAEVTWAINEG